MCKRNFRMSQDWHKDWKNRDRVFFRQMMLAIGLYLLILGGALYWVINEV